MIFVIGSVIKKVVTQNQTCVTRVYSQRIRDIVKYSKINVLCSRDYFEDISFPVTMQLNDIVFLTDVDNMLLKKKRLKANTVIRHNSALLYTRSY